MMRGEEEMGRRRGETRRGAEDQDEENEENEEEEEE